MSSNHTYVMNSEWEALQARIASGNAYVISRQNEADRIAQIAEERRRNSSAINELTQQSTRASIAALREEFDELCKKPGNISPQITTQRERMDSELEGLQNTLENAEASLSGVDRQIDSIAAILNETFQELNSQADSKKEKAENILAELNNLIAQIEGMSPSRFAENEYARLISLRASIVSAVNSGDYQSAIIISQNSILDASRLIGQLVVANERYNSNYQRVSEQATRLRERIETLASESGILTAEFNGQPQEFDYDISFWSNGRFDRIRDMFSGVDEALNSDTCSMERLEELERDLRVLDANLTDCDLMARRERIGAVSAADMAIRIHSSLSDSGWNLDDSGYHDGDERNPYAMNYNDGAGNRVSVVVAPENPEKPSFFIEVFSDDPYSAELTKDGVHATLEENGLEIESIERRNDCHLNPTPEAFVENATAEAMENMSLRKV